MEDFQLLSPSKNYFIELVILDCQKAVRHSGMKDTLNELRSRCWVPQGSIQSPKCYLFVCIMQIPAAPLPDFRVSMRYPFPNNGVDYLGQLHVYPSTKNNKNTRYKVHILLFPWASTRAVHLDLVTDVRSNAFTDCLKRFISRRDVPNMVISDNAKCFIGRRGVPNMVISDNAKCFIGRRGVPNMVISDNAKCFIGRRGVPNMVISDNAKCFIGRRGVPNMVISDNANAHAHTHTRTRTRTRTYCIVVGCQ